MKKYIRDLLGRDKYYLGLKLINDDLKKEKLRDGLYKLVARSKIFGETSKEFVGMRVYVNTHKS